MWGAFFPLHSSNIFNCFRCKINGWECPKRQVGWYLGSIHTDDPIAVPGDIVEVGNGDRLLARRHPVLLGAGVDLEDVRPGGEDRLFPGRQKTLCESVERDFMYNLRFLSHLLPPKMLMA